MSRVGRVIEENGLLVLVLTSFFAILLLLMPALLVADSWMTLVAGRELAEQGLARVESLTVLGLGRDWVDQQWAAQLAFYGLESLGGLRLVVLTNVLLIGSAYAFAAGAARWLGATQRSVVLILVPALLAAPWAWQVRAQAIALPLFAATVGLAADLARGGGRRSYLLLPVMLVWANVHGTVVLGLALILAAVATTSIATRSVQRRPAAIGLGAILASVASPYIADLPGYYRLMLLDPPFRGLIVEWRQTVPEWKTALFFALALVAAGLLVVLRRRAGLFEFVALALTFASGLQAIRSVTWFVLTAIVIVPLWIDRAFGMRDGPPQRVVNRVLAVGCALGLLAGVTIGALKPQSWFESEWPSDALPTVDRLTRDDRTTVYALSRYADWLLWERPGLGGRMAFDVRFEIYPRETIVEIANFASRTGTNWARDADRFDVVVLDTSKVPWTEWRRGLGNRALEHSGGDIAIASRR